MKIVITRKKLFPFAPVVRLVIFFVILDVVVDIAVVNDVVVVLIVVADHIILNCGQ